MPTRLLQEFYGCFERHMYAHLSEKALKELHARFQQLMLVCYGYYCGVDERLGSRMTMALERLVPHE